MARRKLIVLFLLFCLFLTLPPVFAATMTVTTPNPYAIADGLCSLVEAIDNANNDAQTHADCPAGAGADVITLTRNISLSGATVFALQGDNGLPPLTSDITIEGSNVLVSRAPAAPAFRLLNVAAGANVTLNNLRLSNGLMDSGFNNGGGILNDGNLTIYGSTLQNNRVASIFPAGGGIYTSNIGTLTVINSTITGNTALNPAQVFDFGGGIYSQGNVTIRNSTISNNTAQENGGGLWLSGNTTIENSTITGNNAGEFGGGLIAFGGGTTFRINNSTFSNNTAQESGGAIANGSNDIEIFGTQFLNNTATGNPNGAGGAIFNQGGTMTVTNALFQGNRALNNAVGGAVANLQLGDMTVRGSTFTGNSSATNGGAIYAALAPILIEDSLITNNTANGGGGGLYEGPSNVDSITLVRSSVTNNRADFIGGGLLNEGNQSQSTIINSTFSGNISPTFGGGIGLNAGGLVNILNSTFAENSSTNFVNSVGGINAFAGTMTITNTIVANNQNVDCSATNASTSGGYNLTTGTGGGIPVDRWCSFIPLQPTDILNTNPLLDPLAANGNLGPTYTLQAGSPAIDAIPANCPAVLNGIDGRGVPRPAGSCDIGAISSDAVILPVVSFETLTTRLEEGVTAGTEFITIVVDNTAGNLAAPGALSLTIYVRRSGTATDTFDYTSAVPVPLTFTLNAGNWIAPGNIGTFQIPIDLIDDLEPEAVENLRYELSLIGPGVLNQQRRVHTVTFIDNDTPPPVDTPEALPVESTPEATADPELEIFDPAISKIGFLVPGQVGVTGELLEWVIMVRNPGDVPGVNVNIVDIIDARLRIERVDAPGATVSIKGDTLEVTYPVLNPGESVQYSIFTTVLAGETVNNTACVEADNQEFVACATGSAVSALPETGESPLWRGWLMVALMLLTAITAFFTLRSVFWLHTR